MTGGGSPAEVRENAADALEEAILAYLATGRAIPLPRDPGKGEEAVVLARAALATVMREKKISNVALAKTLGKSEGAVRRLTDGSSAVKIDTVLAAMTALGACGSDGADGVTPAGEACHYPT